MEPRYSELTDKILIFTTFWDAEYFLKNNPYSKCQVFSIALTHPGVTRLPNITLKSPWKNSISCLDFFCPTPAMLFKYKEDKDWKDYTEKFNALIVQRKEKIKAWIDSIPNGTYFLCCWENTKNGINCHRKLLYDALTQSKTMKDKAKYIYRHGGK